MNIEQEVVIGERGPCQRPGCTRSDTIKVRIYGEQFGEDPARGFPAGYRLYGLACCGNKILCTTDRLKSLMFKAAGRRDPSTTWHD